MLLLIMLYHVYPSLIQRMQVVFARMADFIGLIGRFLASLNVPIHVSAPEVQGKKGASRRV